MPSTLRYTYLSTRLCILYSLPAQSVGGRGVVGLQYMYAGRMWVVTSSSYSHRQSVRPSHTLPNWKNTHIGFTYINIYIVEKEVKRRNCTKYHMKWRAEKKNNNKNNIFSNRHYEIIMHFSIFFYWWYTQHNTYYMTDYYGHYHDGGVDE